MGKSILQDSTNTKYLQLIGITLLFIISVNCTLTTSSVKGKVIEIDPNYVEYLTNSFDQLVVLFLQQKNQQVETYFQQLVQGLNQTFPQDHTLFALTYLKKDTEGKLQKFNNKQEGLRIISKRNHYELNFNNQIKKIDLLRRFYTHHVHPVLPIFAKQDLSSLETEYFVVFEYNSMDYLKNLTKTYRQIYDYLKLFNVRGAAVQSQNNQTQVILYKKSEQLAPILVETFAGDLNNIEQLADFISVQTLPLLANLDDENYVRIFGSSLDTQFLFIYDQKDSQDQQINQVRKQLETVAHFNRQQELNYQRILFAESTVQFMSKYFDNAVSELQNENGQKSKYRILLTKTDYDHFQLRRWIYNIETYGKPTKQSLIQFIEDVRMKKIDAQYKSEKIPTEEQQSKSILRKIVGKSFIEQVYEKPNKSVIVLFIDSKDPESYKQIKENFQNFTTKYKQVLQGKVVSAIFDLTKNQHKFLSIIQAPKLSLFERTNKKSPKNFKGYPTLQNLKNWVNYQIKDFTIPQNFGEQILPLGGPSMPTEISNNAVNQVSKNSSKQEDQL